MNEKKSGLAGVRAWWLAIPGSLMLIFLIALIATSSSARVLSNVISSSAYYMLMAAAIVVPFSRGHVDLSVFGVASLGATVAACLSNYGGAPAAAAMVIGIFVSVCLGVLNGLLAMLFRRKNVLFMAFATLGLGMLYSNIANAVTGGMSVRFDSIYAMRRVALPLILALTVSTGVFALISFTGGGRRAFNGIYEKDEDRGANTIVSFLFSGALAGIAAALQINRLSSVFPSAFSFSPIFLALLAFAGIILPNAKKSKIGAFLGFVSVIPASIAVVCLQYSLNYANLNSMAINIIFAVLAVIFIILNAVFGSKAAKMLSLPAALPEEPRPACTPDPLPVFTEEKPAPAVSLVKKSAPEAPAQQLSESSGFGALAELASLYESGLITEEVYNKRKSEIISKL